MSTDAENVYAVLSARLLKPDSSSSDGGAKTRGPLKCAGADW